MRSKANFGYYYSVAPQWVLSLTGEAGDIFGWNGQNVLLQDRFFVGGDNLRGFQNAGIGPRDSVSDDALGGQKYYVGSVTLGVPLGLPKELGISGRVFTDFGTLYHLEPTQLVLTPAQLATTGGIQPMVEQSPAIRVSAGVGVSWKSPVGPIRLDVAYPIRRSLSIKPSFSGSVLGRNSNVMCFVRLAALLLVLCCGFAEIAVAQTPPAAPAPAPPAAPAPAPTPAPAPAPLPAPLPPRRI